MMMPTKLATSCASSPHLFPRWVITQNRSISSSSKNFLLRDGIIFAQPSSDTYRTPDFGFTRLSFCYGFEDLRSAISQLTSRTCVGDWCLLEERSCSWPIGERFSCVLAFSRY